MSITVARDEYIKAQKAGLKEVKELSAKGLPTTPAVLDEICPDNEKLTVQDMGTIEIPSERIVGVKSAGRTPALSAGFRPLLEPETEFAQKWINLCESHLDDTGIRDPILCYEYLGSFYVQEGNKRTSVLKHFEAPRIPAEVKRLVPPMSDDPRIKAYYEFMDFFSCSGLYEIQFHRPGDYAKLSAYLGREAGESWSEDERRAFTGHYAYFRQAFTALGGEQHGLVPEEALLIWLHVYSYRQLLTLSPAELKKTLSAIWDDIIAAAQKERVSLKTLPSDEKSGLIARITAPTAVKVAFIHQKNVDTSPWTTGHDKGRAYVESALGDKISVRSYFNADSPSITEELLETAIADGAQVVFTTAPPLLRATLKAAVKYPKVIFLNCSADVPFSSVRGYYCRAYEAKFIMGVLAGAMAENNEIGYIADYPILGVPASINAFALGAQMTNPKAQIRLHWSCTSGNPLESFARRGIRLISNRDAPSPEQEYLRYGDFGTYYIEDDGALTPLGTPCWLWGAFYESVLKSILSGSWSQSKPAGEAVSYWLGMDSGVMDVKLSPNVPEGVRTLIENLMNGIKTGTVSPFARRVTDQNGKLRSDGQGFTDNELLRMDWLCENVVGRIPEFEELLPISRPLVRELGLHRESIAPEKEVQT